MPKERVLVAMSGGVDSSVTAFLLKQAGYDCLGATMLLHGDGANANARSHGSSSPLAANHADEHRNSNDSLRSAASCGSGSDADDAAAIAKLLGFKHEVIDMRSTFTRCVVNKFVNTYEAGRTPNPCIDCNRYLKFDALLSYALEHDCTHIATGHYAQIKPLNAVLDEGFSEYAASSDVRARNNCLDAINISASSPCENSRDLNEAQQLLSRIAEISGSNTFPALSYAADSSKDQSYVLYSLTQERLAHTLLPLGGLIKQRDVRRIAAEQGFVNAAKRDSQGICFVPNNDFATYIEKLHGEPLPQGEVLNTSGKLLGHHQGAIRYTVGQRKGLGVACAHPVYVCKVDAASNTVVLGEIEDLLASSLIADDWIWSAPVHAMETLLNEAGAEGITVRAKIRYRHPAQPCRMRWAQAKTSAAPFSPAKPIELIFDTPEKAIAPGQAVVVYAGSVVLGGGTVLCANN